MVNDSVIMAKEDELEDYVKDIEVKLVRQLVSKNIDLFSDGTTTLVVLAQGLIAKDLGFGFTMKVDSSIANSYGSR
ncbi:hypothetical protein V6N13_004864 [Hibiscus sabdariffa]